MSGIYIHIPFCRQACHYCNFHFSTSLKNKDDLLKAIHSEIDLRHEFLPNKYLDSIYFGGGTPSILEISELSSILNQLSRYYSWDDRTEITLEANPEDLESKIKVGQLLKMGFNRLSVGIQSFDDADLKVLNRVHGSEQAHQAIHNIRDAGFENYSIDLMFGLLGSSREKWARNLEWIEYYSSPHVSCYNLTIEEQTVFHHWLNHQKIALIPESLQHDQFSHASAFLKSIGYDHYEISNYARDGFYALHNTSYWQQSPYLGIGPAAHSFSGKERIWNVANNARYVRGIRTGSSVTNAESLSTADQFNETIMLGLRTKWGILKQRLTLFPPEMRQIFHTEVGRFVENKTIIETRDSYVLTEDKRFLADFVSSEMFITS